MSFLTRLANGLGTVLGVLAEMAGQVVQAIRDGYENHRRKGGATEEAAKSELDANQERLRVVNDEILYLRTSHLKRGSLNEAEKRRWRFLKDERNEILEKLNANREVRTAETIFEAEERLDKVNIDDRTTHILQYNAFADVLGKKCPRCGRRMKLQWRRGLTKVPPKNFYWGCTGWYSQQSNGQRACDNRVSLHKDDFGLLTDTTLPEFDVTAADFEIILTDNETKKIVTERINDLRSDLDASHRRVEISTCPVHGENMVLRRKQENAGLLDAYFLACPYYGESLGGCTFMEKLKSGPQLAALLKSQTGRGIL